MGRHHDRFSEELTVSDTSILMTMESLITQAMGPPQINQVNFKLLRTILHILLRHLRIMDKRIQVSVKEVTEYNELNQKATELEEAQKSKKKKGVKSKGEPQSEDDIVYRGRAELKRGKSKTGTKRGKSMGRISDERAGGRGRRRRDDSSDDDDYDEPPRSRRRRSSEKEPSKKGGQRKKLDARTRSSSMTTADRGRDTDRGRGRDRDGDRDRDRDRGPGTKRSFVSSQSRKPSVEVVTQDDFRDLQQTVKRLLSRAEPPPAPSMPKNKKLMADVTRGTASLRDVMQAAQLSKRIDAAENALERMAQMMQAIASSGTLPKDLAKSIKDTADMGMAAIGGGKRGKSPRDYDEDDDDIRRGGGRDRGGDRRGGGDDEDRRGGRGRADDEDTGGKRRGKAGRDEDYDEDDRGGKGGKQDKKGQKGRDYDDDDRGAKSKQGKGGREYDDDEKSGKGGRDDDDRGAKGKKDKGGRDYDDDDDRGGKGKKDKSGRDYDDDAKSAKSGKGGRDYDDDDRGGKGKRDKGGRDYDDDDDRGGKGKKDKVGRDYDDDAKSAKSGKGGRDYDDDDRGGKGKKDKGGRDYDDDVKSAKSDKGGRDYDDDDRGGKGKRDKGGRDNDDDVKSAKSGKGGRDYDDDDRGGKGKRDKGGRDYDDDAKSAKSGKGGRDYDDDDRGGKGKRDKGGRDYDDDDDRGGKGRKDKSGRDYDEDAKSAKSGKGGRDYDDDDRGGKSKQGKGGRDYDDDVRSTKSGKGGRDYDDDDRGAKGKQGKGGRDYDDDQRSAKSGKGGRDYDDDQRSAKSGKGGRDYDDDQRSAKSGKSGRDYDDDDRGAKGKQGRGGRDYDDDQRSAKSGKGGRDYDDDDDRGAKGKQGKGGRDYDDDDREGRGKQGKGGRDYDDDDDDRGAKGKQGKGGRDYDDDEDDDGGRGRSSMKKGSGRDDDDRGGKRKVTVDDKGYKSEDDGPKSGARGRSKSIKGKGYESDEGFAKVGEGGKKAAAAGPQPGSAEAARLRKGTLTPLTAAQMPCTPNEMVKYLEDLKEYLMKELAKMTSNPLVAAEMAVSVSKKMADRQNEVLSMGGRVKKIQSDLEEYSCGLGGFTDGIKRQFVNMKKQIEGTKKELDDGLYQLKTADLNVEATAIAKLSDQYDELAGDIESVFTNQDRLAFTHLNLNTEIQEMEVALEVLREEKADFKDLVHGLRDKVDREKLVGLLTSEAFKRDMDAFQENMNEATRDLQLACRDKAAVRDLMTHRDRLQVQMNNVFDRVKALEDLVGDPKAAMLSRRLSDGATCGACRVPAIQYPYTRTRHELIDDELRPPYPPDYRTHTCHRWTGGSHTLLPATGRSRRGGHLPDIGEGDRLTRPAMQTGNDGQMYHVDEDLYPCKECNVVLPPLKKSNIKIDRSAHDAESNKLFSRSRTSSMHMMDQHRLSQIRSKLSIIEDRDERPSRVSISQRRLSRRLTKTHSRSISMARLSQSEGALGRSHVVRITEAPVEAFSDNKVPVEITEGVPDAEPDTARTTDTGVTSDTAETPDNPPESVLEKLASDIPENSPEPVPETDNTPEPVPETENSPEAIPETE